MHGVFDCLAGLPRPALVREARRMTGGSPAALRAQQGCRLAEFLAFARAHSPYYRAQYRHLPWEVGTLADLPPVTKAELMADFDAVVTDPAVTRAGVAAFMAATAPGRGLYLDRYLPCTTSGTTARPGLFLHDIPALAVYAALLAARTLPGPARPAALAAFARRGARVALVVDTQGYGIEAALLGAATRRYPRLVARHVRAFSILDPLPALARQLDAFRPAVLFGYATALLWLADEQRTGRLRINPLVAVTSAEWLAPSERARLAASFGCPVRDLYAATEFPAMAAVCAHGTLHVNSDWLILEPVDAAYRPVPPEQPSATVLLTNLANRVQPLIRYDLGDSVTLLGARCPCGSVLPALRLEGRREDILHFRAASGAGVPILPLALTSVVAPAPGVGRFQLTQTAPEALRVRLEVADPAERSAVGAEVVRRLVAYLATQGLGEVRVTLAPEGPARDARTGKFRVVWAEPAACVPPGEPG